MIWEWLAQPIADNLSWSRIEVIWIALAVLGLLPNTVKLWIVGGDWWATWLLWRYCRTSLSRDRLLVAWWVVANALKDQIVLLAFVVVGLVAGQVPPAPITVNGQAVMAGVISGAALITAEVVTLLVVIYTLYVRVSLGVRPIEATKETST